MRRNELRMTTNNTKVTDGPQGHFSCNPERMEELTLKLVNQRRLRDNLCNSVKRENSRCTVLRIGEKYPLLVESMYIM